MAMDELTQQGIAALKGGDKARARFLLRSALEHNLDDLQAWMWLSGAVELDDDRLECLQQVMRIDPGNPAAARGIARLTGKDLSEVLAEAAAAVVAAAMPPAPAMNAKTSQPAGELEPEAAPLVEEKVTPVFEPGPVSEMAAPIAVASEPAPAAPSLTPAAPRVSSLENKGVPIFKARPSLLPILLLMSLAPLFLFGLLVLVINQNIEQTFLPPLLTGLIVIVLGLCLWQLVVLLTIRYTLFVDSIEIARGVFKRSRQTIPMDEIRQVTCRRNIFQRLLGIGSIMIEIDNGDLKKPLKLANLAHCDQRTRQVQERLARH